MDRTGDYEVPKPSRIKLKQTSNEKAEKLYRKEQRRHARDQERISRANGYGVSPPRQSSARDESITPPRNPPRKRSSDQAQVDGDDDSDFVEEIGSRRAGGGGGEWMGGYGRKAREELERREWRDKMAWMAGTSSHDHDPFSAYQDMEDVHIPKRFREAAGMPASGAGTSSSQYHHFSSRTVHHHSSTFGTTRIAVNEVHFSGGPVPPLGSMNDDQYSSWVREGMYRKQHRAELEEAERRRRLREEKERLKEIENEKRQREEEKRIKKLKKEKGQEEEKARARERERWRERWKVLGDKEGEKDKEIVEVELSFNDIPWPIYRPSSLNSAAARALPISVDDLTIDNIRIFIHAIAEDSSCPSTSTAIGPSSTTNGTGGGGDVRKTIREAIRNYHPDRFHARILGKVRESDKELVKEGVGRVSAVLNDLAREGK
ncbi:hypothetical protein I316_04446 [Kwoniella heveanensis BCC8398]|uniref:Uncharacterized protein n=1 Tax=Kwoniella heveanensis BCC8398 TaxID=1296120 RepID=A0A1B9GRP3_9TREE|nr:hypothetical protein I316_04446 [Kwoniella heveanensis BCC8398]